MSSGSYYNIRIQATPDQQEIIIGELVELGFEAFEQEKHQLSVWAPSEIYDAGLRDQLTRWLQEQPEERRILSEDLVGDRNWNAEWEKTIQPLSIGSFYIHPTWSDKTPPEGLIPIRIDPKMAFGTGYHETTRLLLRMLPEQDCAGMRVLDMGSGTGVLAIGALKLGASKAVGIDNDHWCYDNAIENAKLNGVEDRLEIRIGSDEKIGEAEKFDLILANINRNVLMDLAEPLVSSLTDGGVLLLSGILEEDQVVVASHPVYNRLKLSNTKQENEWLAMAWHKNG